MYPSSLSCASIRFSLCKFFGLFECLVMAMGFKILVILLRVCVNWSTFLDSHDFKDFLRCFLSDDLGIFCKNFKTLVLALIRFWDVIFLPNVNLKLHPRNCIWRLRRGIARQQEEVGCFLQARTPPTSFKELQSLIVFVFVLPYLCRKLLQDCAPLNGYAQVALNPKIFLCGPLNANMLSKR
jgi:hypothetical protein